ncbi:hypothetical protein V6N13_018158 [Hibiscus sabdariffa]
MCKCRSHGTFPLFGLQSSHLNICYYHQDLHRRPLCPGSRPGFYGDRRALLLIGAWPLPRRPGIGHALKRHPFSGLVDSAELAKGSSYPEGNFGGNQLLDGSIRPYTQVRRTICTSVSLRASTRVSSGFAPLRHSSPSFGSRQACSHSNPSQKIKTPWSVFQDGPDGEPAGRRPEHAGAEARRDGACWVPRSRRRRLHGRIKGPGLGRHHDPRRSTPRADRRTGSRRSTSDRGASPAPIRFPPDNFKHSLTLFSKSFSSFPRGTCSLSVSRPYLALDGIYRPIRAAFPNNPTRRQRLVVRQGPGTTGLSPSPAPLSRGLGPGPSLRTLLQTTIRTPRATDSQAGLFPVRSPLLRESLFSGLLATSRAANRPRRRDPNTSPDHSIGRSDGRINQVAFLRDVRPAWSSTHYLGRGEAITRREHRSCRGTKCTSYERTGPRPYAHEIFRIRKHDRASMHRRSRIMSIDTLGTPGTTEVHQAATRSLDGQGMAIHPKFHRFRYATQDPYRTPWARRPQGEDIEE